MRKNFIFLSAIILGAAFLASCGSDNKYTPPAITTSDPFAYLEGTETPTSTQAGYYGGMQAKVGTFTSNGNFLTAALGEPTAIYTINTSADGKKAVMDMYDGSDDIIAVADAATGHLTQVDGGYWGWNPVFSPDGTRVLWIGKGMLLVANADGSSSSPTFLTSELDIDFDDARFSPNGTKIVATGDEYLFGAEADSMYNDIWILNADGTNPVQVTADYDRGDGKWFHHVSYSPDGTKILYCLEEYHPADPETETDAYYGYNIYQMDLDGANEVKLTTSDADFYPHVNNNRIMFQSERTGNSEVYTMKADGTGVARLTGNDSLWDGFTVDFGGYYDDVRSAAAKQAKK